MCFFFAARVVLFDLFAFVLLTVGISLLSLLACFFEVRVLLFCSWILYAVKIVFNCWLYCLPSTQSRSCVVLLCLRSFFWHSEFCLVFFFSVVVCLCFFAVRILMFYSWIFTPLTQSRSCALCFVYVRSFDSQNVALFVVACFYCVFCFFAARVVLFDLFAFGLLTVGISPCSLLFCRCLLLLFLILQSELCSLLCLRSFFWQSEFCLALCFSVVVWFCLFLCS